MGPTWVLSAPDGPHVGPMNLAVRDLISIGIPIIKIIWSYSCLILTMEISVHGKMVFMLGQVPGYEETLYSQYTSITSLSFAYVYMMNFTNLHFFDNEKCKNIFRKKISMLRVKLTLYFSWQISLTIIYIFIYICNDIYICNSEMCP